MTPKLLAGWTMLSATCDTCGVPYMHPPGKTRADAECVFTECAECPNSTGGGGGGVVAGVGPLSAGGGSAVAEPVPSAALAAGASAGDDDLEDWEDLQAAGDPAEADFVRA